MSRAQLIEFNPAGDLSIPWTDSVFVTRISTPEALISALAGGDFSAVIIPQAEIELLEGALRSPALPVLVVDPKPDPWRAVEAMKRGAADYTSPAIVEATCQRLISSPRPEHAFSWEWMEREHLIASGRLAAGVAHEINNPAAYVMANLNELGLALRSLEALTRAALPLAFRASTAEESADLKQMLAASRNLALFEEMRTMLEESQEGMFRIREIVYHLRGFSVVEDEPVLVDVLRALQTAIDLLRHDLRHRARIDIDLSPTPEVLVPRARLAQIFLSLLLNALQAFEGLPWQAQGRLYVKSGVGPQGAAEVRIEYDGQPLPPALLASLDDPFALSLQEDRGVSLRLATSRGIARRMGGELSVQSGPEGTVITLLIPAYMANPLPPKAPPAAQIDPIKAATILIVDDEESILRSIGRLLKGARKILSADNGDEAVQILLSDPPPDLVICDIIMPDRSGMDIYHQMAKERPELLPRFLFITGGALTPAARRFCEGVRSRVIEKPFEPTEFRERVREILQLL